MRTQLLQLEEPLGHGRVGPQPDHDYRMLAIQIYTVDDRGVLRFMDCSSQKAIIHHLDRFFFSLSQTGLESVLVGCVSSWNSRAKPTNLFELLMTR